MKNEKSRGIKSGNEFEDLFGLWGVTSLDNLLCLNSELRNQQTIPTYLICEVLNKELDSREVRTLLKDIVRSGQRSKVKEIPAILKEVPDKLYFFLWSLKNSEVLPQEGIISSFELKKSIYNLAEFLALLRRCLRKVPQSIHLHENLGFAYLDLAGLAQYSDEGLLLSGKHIDQPSLLREAVYCFQKAIILTSRQATAIDSSHLKILGMVDDDINFSDNRSNLYLNPWHFLYISSALNSLNDTEVSELYLQRAGLILNSIDDHQNPKIVEQKELLESVYTAIHYGKSLSFDFDSTMLIDIQKKLKRIRRVKESTDRHRAYSPMIEQSLKDRYRHQHAFLRKGKLDTEQIVYLKRVHSLYRQLESSKERDRLIYRLNIPPIKVRGLNKPLQALASQKSLNPPDGVNRPQRLPKAQS